MEKETNKDKYIKIMKGIKYLDKKIKNINVEIEEIEILHSGKKEWILNIEKEIKNLEFLHQAKKNDLRDLKNKIELLRIERDNILDGYN